MRLKYDGWLQVNLEQAIQTPMAQGRSTKIISTSKWIRTSKLSMKHSLSLRVSPRQGFWIGSGKVAGDHTEILYSRQPTP